MRIIWCLSWLLAVGALEAMHDEKYLEQELEYSDPCNLTPEQCKLINHLEIALDLNKKFDTTFKDLKTDEEHFEFVEYCYEAIAGLNTDETLYVCPILNLGEAEKNDIIELLVEMKKYYEGNLLTPENKALFCTLPNHIQSYYTNNFNYKKLTDNLFKLKYLWIAKIFNALLIEAIKIKDKKQIEKLLKKYNYTSDHKKFTAILLYAINCYFQTKGAYMKIIRNLLNAGATVVIQYPDPNPATVRYWFYGEDGKSEKEYKASIPGTVFSNLEYESKIFGERLKDIKSALIKHKNFLLKEIKHACLII